MKPHVGIAIAIGITLTILIGGAVLYLAMPEKSSFVSVERDRSQPDVSLEIESLDPDRPFYWWVDLGARGRDTFRQNPYDADHLRITCFDSSGPTGVQEFRLPPGRSRVVAVRSVSGCADLQVTTRELLRLG